MAAGAAHQHCKDAEEHPDDFDSLLYCGHEPVHTVPLAGAARLVALAWVRRGEVDRIDPGATRDRPAQD